MTILASAAVLGPPLLAGASPELAKYLAPWQVGLAVPLIVASGAISLALQLELERKLLVASVRTVVQLLLVGYVLEWIFSVNQWPVVLALMLSMTLIAGIAAVRRVERPYRGLSLDSILSIGREFLDRDRDCAWARSSGPSPGTGRSTRFRCWA